MRRIIQDIWISKKIFIMLFIGFLFTIWPILIALSTQNFYDEHFYHSKNGHFKHYYSVKLTNLKEIDLIKLQEIAESNFKNASVITNDISIRDPKIGRIEIIGLLNHNIWSPPLIEGTEIASNRSNEIVVGRLVSEHVGTIKVLDKEYHVVGIAGKNSGRDLINVYSVKMYVFLNELPDQLKHTMIQQNTLEIMVRSNRNPKNEMNRFISEIKQHDAGVNASIENESKKYEDEKKSRPGVKEVLSYPYKLFIIALINCINVSYLWIYLKRKEISLRKALGASNLSLFAYIFSQLFLCAVLAAIGSFFIQWLLSKLSSNIVNLTSYFISLSVSHIIIGILLTLAIALVTSFIPLLHLLKIEPAKALKE